MTKKQALVCVYDDVDCRPGAFLRNVDLGETLCETHGVWRFVRTRHWEYDSLMFVSREREVMPLRKAYEKAGFRLCLGCGRVLDDGFGIALARYGDQAAEGCHFNCNPGDAGTGTPPRGVHYGYSLRDLYQKFPAAPVKRRKRPRRHLAPPPPGDPLSAA